MYVFVFGGRYMALSKEKRKVIGLLVSGITDTFSIQLIRGVMRAADNRGLDLIVIPGKYLDRDLSERTEIMYDYQFATLYSYAKEGFFDGLIISANSIGCHTNDVRMRQFVDSYKGIPSILVATRFEGHSCICFDNMNAVKEGIDYLIKREDCAKICEITGPDCNTDVIERHRAYVETLEANGLAYNEKMSEVGDFMVSDESRQAMENLIRNNPDIDAVFCHNDNMAMAAYEVIKKHGMIPGEDIKVFGYDNIQESGALDPPLATVSADPIYLGEEAVECLIEKMRGEQFSSITLPAKFIGRESLGRKYAEERRHQITDEMTLREDFSEIFYRYINERSGEETEEIYQKFEVVMRAVLRSMSKNLDLDDTGDDILRKFDELIKSDALPYMDMEAMLRFIDRQGTRSAEARCGDPMSLMKSRALVAEIYRHLVQAEDKRFSEINFMKQELDNSTKNFVKETLSFKHGNDQSYQVLLGCLDWADVKNACIYIFENPLIHLEGEKYNAPEYAYMRAYLKYGKVYVPTARKQKRKIEDPFIPEELSEERRSMLLAPLFYSEEMYGLFMCDMTEMLFSEGEFIINQLGSAIRMLHILRENEINQQRLEDNLDLISKMNEELDTISKSDVLTGLLNRRGFIDAATEFLANCRKTGSSCIAGYMDMNNLKVVNDRFGHEEGDFSLKSIAAIMCKVMSGGRSVIGRIGGDEFAFITMGNTQVAEKIEEDVRTSFIEFNKSTDKPYNVTASVGMYPVTAGEDISLEDALSYADEALYVAKQTKDRNVLKNVKLPEKQDKQ